MTFLGHGFQLAVNFAHVRCTIYTVCTACALERSEMSSTAFMIALDETAAKEWPFPLLPARHYYCTRRGSAWFQVSDLSLLAQPVLSLLAQPVTCAVARCNRTSLSSKISTANRSFWRMLIFCSLVSLSYGDSAASLCLMCCSLASLSCGDAAVTGSLIPCNLASRCSADSAATLSRICCSLVSLA